MIIVEEQWDVEMEQEGTHCLSCCLNTSVSQPGRDKESLALKLPMPSVWFESESKLWCKFLFIHDIRELVIEQVARKHETSNEMIHMPMGWVAESSGSSHHLSFLSCCHCRSLKETVSLVCASYTYFVFSSQVAWMFSASFWPQLLGQQGNCPNQSARGQCLLLPSSWGSIDHNGTGGKVHEGHQVASRLLPQILTQDSTIVSPLHTHEAYLSFFRQVQAFFDLTSDEKPVVVSCKEGAEKIQVIFAQRQL